MSGQLYLCIESAPLKRGGEFLCYAFTNGARYAVQRQEGENLVFINDSGGEHLIPPKFLKKFFRLEKPA